MPDLDEEEYKATRKLNGLDNEIQVGEYVRTISGNIDKVDALYGMIENTVHLENHKWQSIKNITKYSPNLIDLIEKGDIIQIGNDKYEVIYDKSYEKLGILIPNKNFLSLRHCSLKYIFSKDGIEEFKKILIVTHEQFNSVMYKVKE